MTTAVALPNLRADDGFLGGLMDLGRIPPDLRPRIVPELFEMSRRPWALAILSVWDRLGTCIPAAVVEEMSRGDGGLRLTFGIAELLERAAVPAQLEPLLRLLEERRGPEARGKGAVLIRLCDVQPEAVKWVWPGRIARGKLNLLIGDPGLGKSFITQDIAARVSMGAPWPDDGGAAVGSVIILTAEDGKADTVRPRSDAMGADLTRITILEGVRVEEGEPPLPFQLTRDLAHLETAIQETGAILVVIDPVSAYLAKIDSKTDAEVRGVLAPLAALAERTGVAVLGVMHLTKDTQRRIISRALGSIAFVAAARSVFAAVADDENPGRRLFLPIKLNVAQHPAGLAFRLEEVRHPGGFPVARVVWEADPVTVDVEDALAASGGSEDRTERRDAREFLAEFLGDGERPAAEVFKVARANGIAHRTLARAKDRLRVRSRHEGQPGEAGAWYWSLPIPPKDATSSEMASFGKPVETKAENSPTSPKDATLHTVALFGSEVGTLERSEALEEWRP